MTSRVVSLIAVVVLWFGTSGGLILWGLQERAELEDRTLSGNTQCGTTDLVAGQSRATLTAMGNPILTVPFGREFGTHQRRLEYGVGDPSGLLKNAPCLEIEVGSFIRDTNDAELNPEKIVAKADLRGDRLIVVVTFDRTNASLGKPGSYTGVVSIVDQRIERTDIPMIVTLAYPVWQFPLALLMVVLAPATVYVWLLRKSFKDAVDTESFPNYLFTRNGMLAFGVGAVAAVGVFTATYLNSSSWRGDIVQLITLAGTAFTAYVTAATTVSAAGADKPAAG